jgi:hypothetical protein
LNTEQSAGEFLHDCPSDFNAVFFTHGPLTRNYNREGMGNKKRKIGLKMAGEACGRDLFRRPRTEGPGSAKMTFYLWPCSLI